MECIGTIYFIQTPKTLNRELIDNIQSFPDNIRKQLRLLCKQYEITELYQEPYFDSKLVIKYEANELKGTMYNNEFSIEL